MPTEVILPKVDMDMSNGVVAAWHVSEGDRVEKSMPLFDIETDKATMEVESPATGVLRHVSAPPGTEVPIGSVVAWIYAEGEAIDEPPSTGSPSPAPKPTSLEPRGATPVAGLQEQQATGTLRKLRATPLAKQIAKRHGVDLRDVTGSGVRGRIVKADVMRAIEAKPGIANAANTGRSSEPADTASLAPEIQSERPHDVVAVDAMRRTIAARLTESKHTVPHFYLRRDVQVDSLLAFRAKLNERVAGQDLKISVNDIIIKACARALQSVPDANVNWAGDRLLRFKVCDVAVAVAVEGGLFTPVIRDADKKSLSAISVEMKDLAARARERRLQPHEYQGGAFAISNLGMYGVEGFDAIINPPQASILAVGAAQQRPVLGQGGTVRGATVMSLTLSIDHRAMDGSLGATFLDAIVTGLEEPMMVLA